MNVFPTARLTCRLTSGAPVSRRGEPITAGLPMPKGWCRDVEALRLRSADGTPVPLQARPLDSWSDGSVRWALLDFQATSSGAAACAYEVVVDHASEQPPVADPIRVDVGEREAVVDTGRARFVLRDDGSLHVDGGHRGELGAAVTRIVDDAGAELRYRDATIALEQAGPLRSTLVLTASVQTSDAHRALTVSTRYHFYAGLALVRIQSTLRNPHRAEHAGGYWELGDPGSILVRDWSFVISLPGRPESGTRVSCSVERQGALDEHQVPFLLYQESSGGEHWQSVTHVNRAGVVPLRFRGYRLTWAAGERSGVRATPVVQARHGDDVVTVAQRQFWERFPKAVQVTDGRLRLGLLPGEFPDVHELQGGEQLTEDFVVAFGVDPVSVLPLDWVRDPVRATASPEWYCASAPMPHLVPASEDPNHEYLALVNAAIDGPGSFDLKRERVDEYGWRHFGDLYADHETVKHQGTELFVSHYNNQYDAVAGFAIQFFRTADLRWLTLFEDLARHVIDIDIYHTSADKAAYNRGLFWHTNHHVNAGRSTHRTYPREAGTSGGPSAEHNYNTGVMLYYFMTGDPTAREAVIDLARWVIDMDDGASTPLRWLAGGPTGVASATGSFDYHGPGRGPGNGVVSLLNAFRLTADRRYLDKAEELICRCVHPTQDLEALSLLDAERRWYYTVFLITLGRYLAFKEERGELDERYAYAQASLLHYGRWMAEHEYPYLEKPEILEYPTETWAAQDMRKCEVFTYAARHTTADHERTRFLERAQFFFTYAVNTLSAFPTRTLTRPMVLMLSNGYAHAHSLRHGIQPATVVRAQFEPATRFVPQKQVAKRRLLIAAAIVTMLGSAAALLALVSWFG